MDQIIRLSAAYFWKFSFRNMRNRINLYQGKNGIRSITFHDIPDHRFEAFKNIIHWIQDNYRLAQPPDAWEMLDGQVTAETSEDKLLVTFDDGHADNYRAAKWLNQNGIRAIFFIVPSFIDRSNSKYLEYHNSRGVTAYSLQSRECAIESHGLSGSQLLEMVNMGHQIAAHNYAHRDLGKLSSIEDLNYEILNAVNAVENLTGLPCKDFAVGFGQPDNLSNEAIKYLLDKSYRTYMCFRGLNTPGLSPRYFMRHGQVFKHPFPFTSLCLQNGADHKIFDRQKLFIDRVGKMPQYK